MHHHHDSSYANSLLEARRRIAMYFNEKKAVSPESAIEMTSLDWASLGMVFDPKTYSYIKKTDDNKYWIDTVELEKSQVDISKYGNIFKYVFIGLLAFIIIIFCVVISSMLGIFGAGFSIFHNFPVTR